MASARKTPKADPVEDAAVHYFAARSHDAWRRRLLKTNPEQKGKPRMRLRGGVMVDVNQPWAKLHPSAQMDNMRAARDAYAAIRRFPNDREAASEYVHKCWIKRNKKDKSQSKALFKPYHSLPETEKDKDRAHVDNMKKAIAAARRRAPKTARKAVQPGKVSIRLDAKAWRRLEIAASQLSRSLGREVPPEALLAAGADAMTALAKSIAAETRARRK